MKCQGGVGKVVTKHIACFGGLIAHQIAVFAGFLNVKGVIVRLPPCFAVLMVKTVRGKHFSLLADIADGDHHQQQNFSRLLPCDK